MRYLLVMLLLSCVASCESVEWCPNKEYNVKFGGPKLCKMSFEDPVRYRCVKDKGQGYGSVDDCVDAHNDPIAYNCQHKLKNLYKDYGDCVRTEEYRVHLRREDDYEAAQAKTQSDAAFSASMQKANQQISDGFKGPDVHQRTCVTQPDGMAGMRTTCQDGP